MNWWRVLSIHSILISYICSCNVFSKKSSEISAKITTPPQPNGSPTGPVIPGGPILYLPSWYLTPKFNSEFALEKLQRDPFSKERKFLWEFWIEWNQKNGFIFCVIYTPEKFIHPYYQFSGGCYVKFCGYLYLCLSQTHKGFKQLSGGAHWIIQWTAKKPGLSDTPFF